MINKFLKNKFWFRILHFSNFILSTTWVCTFFLIDLTFVSKLSKLTNIKFENSLQKNVQCFRIERRRFFFPGWNHNHILLWGHIPHIPHPLHNYYTLKYPWDELEEHFSNYQKPLLAHVFSSLNKQVIYIIVYNDTNHIFIAYISINQLIRV